MAIELIAEHLKTITGLDSCSVGMSVVEQAVNRRMLACDTNSHIEYYNVLINSNNELNMLIDQVMVPESWFFRGQETFKYLKEYLVSKASGANPNKIRILTIPCATGEEPYSIAITLTECGYTQDEFVIDAIDIAQESLRLAKEAVFTEHSFRDENDLLKQRYFSHIADGYKLNDLIISKVAFSYGNIFYLKAEAIDRYDVVFCRNLLIYFDKETQRKALNKIDALMADDGILFIGHGEAGCIAGSQFEKIDAPNTFAFSKAINRAQDSIKKDKRCQHRELPNKSLKPYLTAKSIKKPENSYVPIDACKIDYIGEAIRLADEGKLDKAIEKCKKAISADGASADALCLLGVIHDANGDRIEATNYYNRALHLMPDHYQSLMHLASHAERNGDKSKASDYRLKAMQSKNH